MLKLPQSIRNLQDAYLLLSWQVELILAGFRTTRKTPSIPLNALQSLDLQGVFHFRETSVDRADYTRETNVSIRRPSSLACLTRQPQKLDDRRWPSIM
jgi:hypothetical protein